METSPAHTFEDTLNSAVSLAGDAGSWLWHAAYDHREAVAGAALLAGAVFFNRAGMARTAVDLAADWLPLPRAAAAVQSGAAEDLSFAHLTETMAQRGLTTADLAESVTPVRSLGHGADFEAFSIKDMPEYVLRKGLGEKAIAGDKIQPLADMFSGRNIGQPIGITGSLQILKAQPGEALVTPSQLEGYARRWALRRQTRMLDQVPQESFDSFARTIKEIDDHGLWFDAHGGNAILDRGTMRLGPVDVSRRIFPEQVNSRARFEATFLPHVEEVKVEPYYSRVKARLASAATRAGLPDL